MCTTCGCGSDHVTLDGVALHHGHDHDHDCGHDRRHGHDHHHGDHSHHGHDHPHAATRTIRLERDILEENVRHAAHNRRRLATAGTLALNLVSSPGAGKTTLLVRTIEALKERTGIAVIEGDQQTSADADRIRATGVPAVQINTGKGCHLDAHMVGHALDRLQPPEGGVLFIENVGNLVCPADFDLGETAKVAIVSITEGEDKPLKYPDIFAAARLVLINKIDLAPHLDADVPLLLANARRVSPQADILTLSARTGEGFPAWLDWLEAWRSRRA